MHIVNISNARGHISRYPYCVHSMCSFEYKNEVTRNYERTVWKPFRYSNKEAKVQDIYATEVPSLQKISLRLLQKYIICTAEVFWYLFESESPTYKKDMHDIIQYLVDHVVCKCPPDFVDEVCRTIMDCVEYLTTNSYLMQHFTNVLLHANLKKLDLFGRSRELQRAVYCRLDGLTKLEMVAFKGNTENSELNQFPSEIMVLRGVKKMPNLKIIIFHDRCTDSIVIAAARHCPKLKSLNVFGSKSVTNNCTEYLAKCQELTEVNFLGTSVNVNGFVNILLGCSKLTDISSSKHIWHSIMKVRKKDIILDLKYISEELDCSKYFTGLETCPKLTTLSLNCEGFDNSILKIGCLDNLTDLTIDKGDFCKNEIDDYLKLKGEKLNKLTLRECTGVNIGVVKRSCPNLKTLEILKVSDQSNDYRKPHEKSKTAHWDFVFLLLVSFLVTLALIISSSRSEKSTN